MQINMLNWSVPNEFDEFVKQYTTDTPIQNKYCKQMVQMLHRCELLCEILCNKRIPMNNILIINDVLQSVLNSNSPQVPICYNDSDGIIYVNTLNLCALSVLLNITEFKLLLHDVKLFILNINPTRIDLFIKYPKCNQYYVSMICDTQIITRNNPFLYIFTHKINIRRNLYKFVQITCKEIPVNEIKKILKTHQINFQLTINLIRNSHTVKRNTMQAILSRNMLLSKKTQFDKFVKDLTNLYVTINTFNTKFDIV